MQEPKSGNRGIPPRPPGGKYTILSREPNGPIRFVGPASVPAKAVKAVRGDLTGVPGPMLVRGVWRPTMVKLVRGPDGQLWPADWVQPVQPKDSPPPIRAAKKKRTAEELINSATFYIPKKYREPFLGDLCEDIAKMRYAGMSDTRINCRVAWQGMVLLICHARSWIAGLVGLLAGKIL